MFLQVERRGFAGAEEVRDVLHLDEGHGRGLELDAGRSNSQVDEPGSKWWSDICIALGDSSMHTHLQRATPSFKAPRRSPAGRRSPSVASIQARTSLAAAGVYLSRRILRKSRSRDVTEAMVGCVCWTQVVCGAVRSGYGSAIRVLESLSWDTREY